MSKPDGEHLDPDGKRWERTIVAVRPYKKPDGTTIWMDYRAAIDIPEGSRLVVESPHPPTEAEKLAADLVNHASITPVNHSTDANWAACPVMRAAAWIRAHDPEKTR
jgi:hypothetical protein